MLTAVASDESLGKSPSPSPDAQSPSDTRDEKPTLVIGDVHGHLDRLEALLKQEHIIGTCPDCEGSGDNELDFDRGSDTMCFRCQGDGIARVNFDVKVVLLGDVGHFGHGGSPTGDLLTWQYANRWADVVLWGNHDRAVVDQTHVFGGYEPPNDEVIYVMRQMAHEGRLRMACAAHGYLLTHAGLHSAFKHQKAPVDKTDPYAVADYINSLTGDDTNIAIIDAVSRLRGGGSQFGGILWRDYRESLYDAFPQVFGHSASREHLIRQDGDSFCVDIGGKGDLEGDACLGGIWLPEAKPVKWEREYPSL